MVLKSVAITGASGMLGKHFVLGFTERDIFCRQIARSANKCLSLKEHSIVQYDFQSLRSESELEGLFEGVDAVIHCAAAVPSASHTYTSEQLSFLNVGVTEKIGKWSKRYDKPLVYISGATVYENTEAIKIKESAKKVSPPFDDYGKSKWAAELALSEIQIPKLICLRPTSIYGSWQSSDKLIPSWLSKASRGEEIRLSPPFESSVNFVHCEDVVRAAFLALSRDSYGAFNIPGPSLISFKELAEACVNVAGAGKVTYLSDSYALDVKRKFDLDGSKANSDFGYTPQISLFMGLEKTLMYGKNTD